MSVLLKRVIRQGDVGIDVRVVKRALKKAGYGHGIILTNRMGGFAVRDLKAFQKAHKLTADGIYGMATHAKLVTYFDAYGKTLYASYTVTPPALAKARAMLAFAREFDSGYSFGGEHDGSLADDTPHGRFDCSSSTSFLLYHFGLMPVSQAQVSGWFESYGDRGRGQYVTIHAAADHVWVEFTLPEGWFRFDTSPHGDGGFGPRVRTGRRPTYGFVERHPRGL